MKLLYFAWLKTRTGVGEEEVSPPPEVTTVRELLDWIRSRGGGYAEALSDLSVIKVAINQEFARPDDPVAPGDEVALFPPVTGG
ncbi:MAG: molybdopterin converting factor subunit 1 [Kiloniellales bacterium]|nr:molybdopterin converting factor subunit 1 [Kiloniellales bacterium]MDJ0972001.1 molybdopterin converting factor subunit 1 [Kiloniellales bacterium]MDJ0981091.1 molybdopterin converting factor subunit 1 [Kiloniellales bacterium]